MQEEESTTLAKQTYIHNRMCRSQKPGLTRIVYQRLRIEVGPQVASFGSAAACNQIRASSYGNRIQRCCFVSHKPIIDCFVYTRLTLCRHPVTTSLQLAYSIQKQPRQMK